MALVELDFSADLAMCEEAFSSSAVDLDKHEYVMSLVVWIWILAGNADPDLEGKNLPTKKEKKLRMHCCRSSGCSLLRSESVSPCSLHVLHGGLGIFIM
jgi:hypothetical protein